MDTIEIPEALALRPGDHLLVRVSTHTTDEQVDELLVAFKERLPDVPVTVIAAEQLAVVRGGE